MAYFEDVEYLPNELQYKILLDTPRDDILTVCRNPPNKYFNDICNYQSFWQEKTGLDYPLLYQQLINSGDLPLDWRPIYINGYKYDNIYISYISRVDGIFRYKVNQILEMRLVPELSAVTKYRRMKDMSIYIIPLIIYKKLQEELFLLAIPKNYTALKLFLFLECFVGGNKNIEIGFRASRTTYFVFPEDFNNEQPFENIYRQHLYRELSSIIIRVY